MEMAELRTKIVSGEYQISADLVAKAMLEGVSPKDPESDSQEDDEQAPPPSS